MLSHAAEGHGWDRAFQDRHARHAQSGLAALQTFLKVVNYQHLMPTRYTLDVDLKSLVTADVVDNSTKRIEVRKVRSLSPFLETCTFNAETNKSSAVMAI